MLESLFNKFAGLKACNFIKKRLEQVLSCEICKIFKNTYFEEHLRMGAFVLSTYSGTYFNLFHPYFISYRNQSHNLRCYLTDWFLYVMKHWVEMGSIMLPYVIHSTLYVITCLITSILHKFTKIFSFWSVNPFLTITVFISITMNTMIMCISTS